MTRPLPVIALYPRNSSDTQLLIQVVDNGTVIAIRYIASTTTNESITYVDKTAEDVVQEINKLNIPLQARAIHSEGNLIQGDIVSPSADYVLLDTGFNTYDRIDNGGVVLRAKKISVRHKSASRIRTITPYLSSSSLPWYPRITNGSFSQQYKGKLYHFYVAEFDQQSWSTAYGKPFKDVSGIQPNVLNKNSYQLPRYPVYWNGQNITIYNGDVPITNTAIEDVDINNGILYTNPNVYLQEGFTVDYSYLEKTYIYKGVNINGHFSQNPIILDKYVVIYMLPAEGPSGLRKKTVFHVIGDSVDAAINSIVLEDASVPIAIIGAYNIRQLFSTDKINVLDTRVKGGGLKRVKGPVSPVHDLDDSIESEGLEIEDVYAEAYRFWDLGNYDGEAYPGAAAVAIDLPVDLQEVMSLSDIKKKTSKFMAAGVYPSIRYTSRDLPAVTGLSAQVSCAYNLDFSEVFESTDDSTVLAQNIPNEYKGIGWFLDSYSNPKSVLSGDWDSFSGAPDIQDTTPASVEVDTFTGISMSYLKGSSWAGISWEERTVVYNPGSVTDPISYTPWQEVTVYDTKEVPTGQISKSYLSFSPEDTVKQYKNVQINSPYLTGDFKGKLETGISDIIDSILDLQAADGVTPHNTEIISGYTNVTAKTSVAASEVYLTASPLYKHLYNMEDTYLEDKYATDLYNIGQDFIHKGTYDSGHYYKLYLPDYSDYTIVGEELPLIVLDFNQPTKLVNDYLGYRHRKNSWSGFCDSGRAATTGATTTLMGSAVTNGSFVYGVPLYFTYYPVNTGAGYYSEEYSGIYFSDPLSLTGTETDVAPQSNTDYLYNFSLPAFMSTCVANSGEIWDDASVAEVLTGTYGLAVDNTIDGMQNALYGERTYTGLPTTTHWFVGHNRLGTHLGNNLFKLIEGYNYVKKYNQYRDVSRDVTTPVGCSQESLSYMFSGIEKILDVGYDAVYHNLLRGGIVEPDMALTLYGYGWYLNNWETNYGIASKTYSKDYRNKFAPLFENGLKQMVKNTVTSEGELLETSTVYGSTGPFASSTVSSILYPLAEGLKYNYTDWVGPAEGVTTTLIENYGVEGLYYADPYKSSTAPGKEIDVLGGLMEVYKAIASTGSHRSWEPMASGLDTLRATEFLPGYAENSLGLWQQYNAGVAETGMQILKEAGINTLNVPLDYMYWTQNSGDLHTKFDSLLNTCNQNNIRVIPTLLGGIGTAVTGGGEAEYTGYGATGGNYFFGPTTGRYFVTGDFSGQQYLESFVNNYDNDPAIVAWSIVDKARPEAQACSVYNAFAYLIKEITDTPVIYNIGDVPSRSDLNAIQRLSDDATTTEYYSSAYSVHSSDIYSHTAVAYNPNIDKIGISPNPLYGYFIDVITGLLPKDTVLNRYGQATYGNYSLATSFASGRDIPIIYSDLFVKTGSSEGLIYTDQTTRNVKQVSDIQALAESHNISITGEIPQENTFTHKFFYPTGYVASYDSQDLIREMGSWSSREQGIPFETGEVFRQIQILQTLHSGLDTLNYKYSWPTTQYSTPSILFESECDNLDYYNTTWNSVAFFESTGDAWQLSGQLDYDKYNTFITDWGQFLYTVSNRLDING